MSAKEQDLLLRYNLLLLDNLHNSSPGLYNSLENLHNSNLGLYSSALDNNKISSLYLHNNAQSNSRRDLHNYSLKLLVNSSLKEILGLLSLLSRNPTPNVQVL